MDAEEYRRIAEAEDSHWWYRGVRRLLATVSLGRLRAVTGRFLDAGCGPGGNSTWVPPEFEVVGVDIAGEALRYASVKRPEMRLAQASVTALPFRDATFDAVQSITVVCHSAVGSVESAFSEYRRVLRPGGLLAVVEPAFEVFRRPHDRVVSAERRFRVPELRKALEDLAFEVVTATYFFACLTPAALALAALDRFSPTPQRKSDLERSGLVDPVFERLCDLEVRVVRRRLEKGGKPLIPFGTSAVVVAVRP